MNLKVPKKPRKFSAISGGRTKLHFPLLHLNLKINTTSSLTRPLFVYTMFSQQLISCDQRLSNSTLNMTLLCSFLRDDIFLKMPVELRAICLL